MEQMPPNIFLFSVWSASVSSGAPKEITNVVWRDLCAHWAKYTNKLPPDFDITKAIIKSRKQKLESDEQERTLFESSQRGLQRREKKVEGEAPELVEGSFFLGEKCDGHQKLTNVEENILWRMLMFCHRRGVPLSQVCSKLGCESLPKGEDSKNIFTDKNV